MANRKALYFDPATGGFVSVGKDSGDVLKLTDAGFEFGTRTLAVSGTDLVWDSGNLASESYVGTQLSSYSNTTAMNAAIDAAVAGLDFQADILDIQVDATLNPGATPTLGDRYIISNAAALHTNFGTPSPAVADDDIVEFDGSTFEVNYDVSALGEGALVWNRANNTFQRYDGADWSEFGGLSGVTAGAGMTKTGSTIDIVLATNSGLVLAADSIAVGLNVLAAAAVDVANDSFAIIDADDSSNSKKESIADLVTAMTGEGLDSAAGVFSLNILGVTAAVVDVAADSIAILDATDSLTKLESIADLVAAMKGTGITQASGVLSLTVDDSTVELNTDTVRVKASGITANELATDAVSAVKILADAVTAAKLAANAVQADSNDVSHLCFSLNAGEVDAAALFKPVWLDTIDANDEIFTVSDISASAQAAGFIGLSGSASMADTTAMNILKLSGILVAPPTTSISEDPDGTPATTFSAIGSPVYVGDNGLLTTLLADITAGSYLLQVGVAVSSTQMVTDFRAPVIKP